MKNCLIILFFVILFQWDLQFAFADPLTSQMQETLSELLSTQEEFNKSTAGLQRITRRVNFLTKKINLFLIFGTQSKCIKEIQLSIDELGKIILKLEKKRCPESLNVKNCISAQMFDNYFPNIRNLFEKADEIFKADENINKINDVCEK